jgi:FecR protein
MGMSRFTTFLMSAVFVFGALFAFPARPQDASVKPIGKCISVTGDASIEHTGAVVVQAALGSSSGRLKIGDPIFLGDIVQTGADGRVGITFTDGTAFDLSKNAHMVMTEFVYDPNSHSNSTLLSLTKGEFTFVAGKIAKTGDMKIDTPAATMGIRGTTPHVEVLSDGTVKFSTLIEEGKDKVLEKYGAATTITPRQGQGGSGTDVSKPLEKFNIQICKNC